jgi:hypothetical protein
LRENVSYFSLSKFLNLKIQIDFFEPVFIPALRQKLFPPKGGQVIVANLPAVRQVWFNSSQKYFYPLSFGHKMPSDFPFIGSQVFD